MEEKVLFCIIVEDEPLAQKVLENYISQVDALKLVAKCQNIEEAFNTLMSGQVDIIFLDLNLNTENGLELIRRSSALRKTRYYVIITSAISPRNLHDSHTFDLSSIQLIDYLTKPFSYERFESAIQKIIFTNEKSTGLC
jgi:response regulator of citrate/malate metabolism